MSDLLTTFKQYLLTLKLSLVSRKLYLSDVNHFLTWLGNQPTLDLLSSRSSYTRYIESLRSSASAESMIKRTLASLKQFGTFIAVTYNVENPAITLSFAPQNSENLTGNIFAKYIKHFTNYLNEEHLSPLTIKSYKSDITRYLDWGTTHLAGTKINGLLRAENIGKYLNHLSEGGSAIPSTIDRKSKSLARFGTWLSNVYPSLATPDNMTSASQSQFLSFDAPNSPTGEEGKIGAFETPDQTSIPVKKNNYRKFFPFAWPTFSLASVVSLAVLLLFVSALAVFGYSQFAKNVRLTAAYPSTPVTPNRQISFQGRLEDAGGTPITTATNLTFKLFDAATSGTQLYSTGVCSITPDSDGVFSTQIGGTCGSTITSSVFTENANVYLEVTVVAETLTPRQQIASVAYALNSETLQGFPISSTVSAIRNTVVPMDQWGEILVGEQSPRLTGVSGTFQISAPALSLTTKTGSNGNITFAPDGTGQVNVNGNTTATNFFNVSNAQLTTGSLITGTAANNNSGFKLIDLLSGSSPTSKFSVDNAGNTIIGGTLTLPNSNTLTGVTNYTQFSQGISVGGATTYHLDGSGNLNVNAATINGTANIGNGSAPVTLNGTSVTLTGFNCSTFANGGALTTDSSGVVSCSNDDNSGGGGSNMWQDDGGAISPSNSTWDVLIGATATTSAKIGLININSGTPTASIAAGTANNATYLKGTGFLGTENKQTLTLGESHTGNIVLAPGGVTALTAIGANLTAAGTFTLPNSNTITGITNYAQFGQGISVGGSTTYHFDASGNLVAAGISGTSLTDSTLTPGSVVFAGAGGLLSQNNNNFFWNNTLSEFGIGTNSPLATFDVRSTLGTVPVASFSGNTAMATVIADQSGIGDLFTASKSGATKFVVTNAGNVGIGVTNPTNKLEIGGATSTISNSSGDITINPASGNLSLAGANLINTNNVYVGSAAYFAGGTTYYVDNAGNAKFLDLQAVDTGNPGLTVGNGSIGFIKVGGSTISDNAGDLSLVSDSNSLEVGAGDGGTPVATTIRGAAATGTNINGANITVDASNGTGSGGSGSLIFRTAPGTSTTATSVDATSSNGASSATTMSWSHTVSGTNRLLTVGVSLIDRSTSVTSITYGAQTLTKLGAISQGTGDHPRSEIWYLIAPNTGINTITVTTGAATFMEGGAVSFNNVNQTTPVGTYAFNTGAAGTTASVTVAGVNGDLILDALSNWTPVGPSTPGSGQTQRYNATSDGSWRGAGSTKAGAPSVSMSWTLASTQDWAISGVSIHNVGNAGVDTLTTRLLIDQNGNVGIDNATPGQALDVTGNATVSGNVTMGGQLQIGRFAANPTALGAGSQIFNTTTNTFQCNNGSVWSTCGGTLFDNTNLTVANGSFITVAHNQNTNNLLSTAWVQDAVTGLWNNITNLSGQQVVQNLQNQWNEALASGLIHTQTAATSIATTSQVNTGTGADGAITVSSLNTNINTTNLISGRSCVDGGDAVMYSVTGLTTTTATLSTSPSTGCLNAGDEVLLINQQGINANFGNVGNWETLRVAQVSGSTVTFTTGKTKFYGNNATDDSNLGTSQGTNQLVMLQRVPNYTNVTVNSSDSFVPSPWSAPLGGVMFFRASGTVTIGTSGIIHANARGYTGGAGGIASTVSSGAGGEAFCGLGGAARTVAQAGLNGAAGSGAGTGIGGTGFCGGGGGSQATSAGVGSANAGGSGGGGMGNATNSGSGGGGGYGTNGSGGGLNGVDGGTNTSGNGALTPNQSGGGGGGSYGDPTLTSKLMFGSGGGGGGLTSGASGGAGGAGGGIVYIAANTLNVSGTVQATGANGGAGSATTRGGGGGGAGGSIRIDGNTLVLGSSLVQALATTGGVATNTGGAGGTGIIATYYATTISGTTSPTSSQSLSGSNSYGLFHSNAITVSNTENLQGIRWEQAGYAIPTGNGETMTDTTSEVAQWNFNQTSGTTATNDAGSTTCGGTGSACNGTLANFANTSSQDAIAGSGWTATDRRWGAGSLAFDGTNDTVNVGNQSALSFDRTNAFSLASWVKINGANALNQGQAIISKLDSSSPNSGYELSMTLAGLLRFNLVNTVTTNQITVTTTKTINDGKWHHVAATYDGSGTAAGVKLYIDGVAQGVTNDIDNLTGSTTNGISVFLGSRNNNNSYLNGDLDATAVFSRVLSAKEVASNAQWFAGQIEMQTRTGATQNPNDGTWEAWKGATTISLNNANTASNWVGNGTGGINWTKLDNSIPGTSNTTGTNGRIPLGASGGDNTAILAPSVILDGGTYKMWYSGNDGTSYRIYYATSSDGVTWTKFDNSVPTASDTTGTNGRIPLAATAGRADITGAFYPSVIKDGSTYRMWYVGNNAGVTRILEATSPDGLTWTKLDNTVPTASDTTGTNGRIPIAATAGRGDITSVFFPNVIKDGSTYKMWYSGVSGSYRIYYATSSDALTWTKLDNTIPSNSDTTGTNGRIPLGSTAGTVDTNLAAAANVIKDGSTYKMWYTGTDASGVDRITYATSSDGLTWTKYNNAKPAASNTSGTNGQISVGTSGTGDANHVLEGSVLLDTTGGNNSYKMWYTGYRSATVPSIYYATDMATPATGDVTRTGIPMFEDENETTAANITKLSSVGLNSYAEATISPVDISSYDYISLWIRASQTGNSVSFGFGNTTGTEQVYPINIDAANTWQKVYINITNIPAAKRNAVTKLRFTNLSASANTIYIDNIVGERDLSTDAGSNITSTPNTFIQYRAIFTTTNTAYQPTLNNVSLIYNNGYKVVQIDANNVALYNYTGSTQALKLDVTGAAFTNLANPWTNAGSYVYPTGFQSVRVYDGSGVHYLGLADDGTNINLSYDGTTKFSINSTGDLSPGSNNTQSLGSDTLRYKDLFLGPNTLHIGTSASDEYTIGYNTASNYLGFYVNGAGAATLVMDSSNNVGIGLTNPAATLNTYHGVAGAPATTGSTDTAIGDRFGVGVVALDFGTYANGTSWIQNRNYTDYTTNYNLALEPNGGNLGIGNATPNAKIDVTGTASISGVLTLGNGTTNAIQSPFGPLTLNYKSAVNTWAAGLTVQDTTGNVGIGTTSPTALLDVRGNIVGGNTTGNALIAANLSGDQTAGNPQYTFIGNSGTGMRRATSNVIAFDTGSTERVRIDASGNFAAGEGVTGGTTILDIAGTATTHGVCRAGAGTTAATNDQQLVACSGATGADYAELYPSQTDVQAGDIVVPTNVYATSKDGQYQVPVLAKASNTYVPNQIGVISQIDSNSDENSLIGHNINDGDNPKPLALNGRVLTKISAENGNIQQGDYITSSSVPGVGMKATKAGFTVGRALASWTPDSGKDQVLVFIAPTYYDPDLALNNAGEITVDGNPVSGYVATTPNGITSKIGAFAAAAIAQLKAGFAQVGTLQVGTISPLASNQPIAITGPVIIQNTPDSTDAGLVVDGTIEAATISARVAKLNEIEADNITANNIVADTITANHITGLDSQIASMAGNLSDSQIQSITDRIKARLDTLTGNIPTAQDLPTAPVATDSSLLAATSFTTPIASDAATLASLDADFVTINNYLAVIGQATITTLDVTNTLNVNSLQSKTGTLALQPLGGIINLANNTLIVDSTGEVAINGNLTVNGQILAKSAEINTLALGTASTATPSSELGQLLSIYNEQGQAVATIDASGSANLAAVTTQLITIASASNASDSATPSGLLAGAAQSNATAGESTLTSPNTELTINSPYVTTNSLVYLTPTGNTENKVLFVKSKESCATGTASCKPSFTVGIDTPATSDISFNWWIIQLKP